MLVGSLFLAVVTTRKITGIVKKVEEVVIGLSKGDLKSTIDYQANNEFGSLVERMNFSFKELLKYVETIDYVMGEYAKGNFACATDVEFLGDFKNIKISVRNFRSKISDVLSELHAASEQVNVGAGQVARRRPWLREPPSRREAWKICPIGLTRFLDRFLKALNMPKMPMWWGIKPARW